MEGLGCVCTAPGVLVDKTAVLSELSCEELWLVSVLLITGATCFVLTELSADDEVINAAAEVVICVVVVDVVVDADGEVVNGLVVVVGGDLVVFVVVGDLVVFVVVGDLVVVVVGGDLVVVVVVGNFAAFVCVAVLVTVINGAFVVVGEVLFVVCCVIVVVVCCAAAVIFCDVVVGCALVSFDDGLISCDDWSELPSTFNIHIIMHGKPLQVDYVLNHSIHYLLCHNFLIVKIIHNHARI